MRRVLIPLVALLAWTSAPRAQHETIPSPESVIGFAPCSDRQLATHEQISGYFRRLDAASDRVQVVEIGKTVEGRAQLMAIISSEENLLQLGRMQAISRRLALGRGLTDEQARRLAGEGRAVVWIDFGLHSNEVAPAQAAPLIAYRAATDDSPEMRAIRSNVIFLLLPDMNPDGTTLVADWYMRHVGGRFERSAPPELYHRYAGHDNNRDWFMFNLPESRNVAAQLYREWFPQIVYNQHQAGPFPSRIFVPPFDDPMNPNIPPLVMRGVNLAGDAITRRLDREGKRGAVSRVAFDAWWNGGMRTAPYFHNMIGILTETAHPSATPARYDRQSFPATFANGVSTREPSVDYPSPYLGGEWHLRDSCEYISSASFAVLDLGARRREEWLYDIYRMGQEAVAAGGTEAYVIPTGQWDPGAAVKMVNVLRWGGVEVQRAADAFRAGGREYAAGSFVVPGAQPFRPYVTDLLNPQEYPDLRQYPGGPPKRPYDITGWTLPFQMGVRVDKVAMAAVARENVEWASPPPVPPLEPSSAAYAIDTRQNDAFTLVNRLLAAGEVVQRAEGSVAVDAEEWPAGTFIVAPGEQTHRRLTELATPLGVSVAPLASPPAARLSRLGAPRIGLYHAFGGNMDEGWTRFVLEQFGFPYERLLDRTIRAGSLRASFDVIVLPDADYNSMLGGLSADAAPEEYTGGMTPEGIEHLRAFVTAGGTLVTLDTASELPMVGFGLPVRSAAPAGRDGDFFVPGSLLRVEIDRTHPVGYGMPGDAAAFVAQSPVFGLGPAGEGRDAAGGVRVIARFAPTSLLMSGWLLGERTLASRPAALDVPLGAGRVIMLGFRTQHRGQTHGTYKLLFNALFLPPGDREPGANPR